MKKLNLFKPSFISLSFIFIVFLSVSFVSSCNKNAEMKDTSMKDSLMKNKSMDDMEKKMDKNMDNNMMDKSMSNMMNKMKGMKMTGNTDVDFVNMMIMHHQGAIEMATTEIASGKKENVKSLANNIIKDQQKEIATMQNWLEKNKDKKSTSGDNSKKLMESMDDMMDDNMKMTGDHDNDFLSMMIMHHEGAVDMADVEVDNGTDPEIKKMAQEMINKQKAEIDQMKNMK
ncbi:MAG: DUF305 domain-containing protein [Ignavibacteria bacterium]